MFCPNTHFCFQKTLNNLFMLQKKKKKNKKNNLPSTKNNKEIRCLISPQGMGRHETYAQLIIFIFLSQLVFLEHVVFYEVDT